MPRFSGKKTDTGVPVTIDRKRYTENGSGVALEGGVGLGEKPGSICFPIQIDTSGYLKVYFDENPILQTEYSDGDSSIASKGTLIMGDDGANIQNIAVGSNGRLQVEVVGGEYDGVQYQDGTAVGAPFGTVMMGHDGSNVFPVAVDSNGYLQISHMKASFLNSMADVTLVATSTTQIVESLISRLSVLIGNKRTNENIFRIGDSNVGVARGIELAPGQSISIETTEAVYGYNPGGSNEAVSVILIGEEDDSPELPAVPILISPTSGSTVSSTSVTFQWNSSPGATNYQIRVSVDPAVEDSLFHEDLTAGATSKNYIDFPNDGTVYYWKVRAYNDAGYGDWSTIWSFINGDDGVPVIESGHVGYYDFAPWGTRFFKFVSDVPDCQHSIQVSNTPGSSNEPSTVHLLIKRGSKPTIAEFESTWEMPVSIYDCGLGRWIPAKDPSAEDLYWKYNTGSQAEFVIVNEPMGSYTFYIMLYNAGGEAVNNQYLTVHYND